MAGTKAENARILNAAFKRYRLYIYDETENALREWCEDMIYQATKWRIMNPQAHNFTGNLLNSIVVGLYRDRQLTVAYYSSNLVPKAIQPKMNKRARRSYYFKRDYEGVKSKYLPEVKTNKGWGADDAERFMMRYQPPGGNMFDIVVAYTVEYADWVQQQRGTTGIMQTWQQAKVTGMTFLKIA